MTRIKGDISKRSRLYKFLKERELWKATGIASHPELYVTRLGGSHEVYLVYDGRSHKKFILKSFLDDGHEKASRYMEKEYERLKQADRLINHHSWVHVARPLYKSRDGGFFVEQYAHGTVLGHYMKEAMSRWKDGALYEKLTMLAGFLALLHKSSKKPWRVDPSSIEGEVARHACQASREGAMTPGELHAMKHLIEKACFYGFFGDEKRSLVHGDVNPSNFLYNSGRLYVIDMERAAYKDPAYDLGTMAGELFHYAMYYSGDPYSADPFIGHLYWTYAGNFRDQLGTFIRLTKRNPLYMANSLLRIARQPYFSQPYKRRLAFHAKECLKSLKRFKR
ncbi:putative aminoglycoside phosphotransferase [Methanocella conradii HZ254]|uniref:Aminoglycoside phosphotransferase n=1 Tax=Methanocella conradii (strain DSM 24694 / JCM 17849 / CGMCC 1.5162 / HZ254) TaxID=1041930 RepID=H8I7R7_METCZ|nr:aminoglycoside phosphotransferase family protein [Methanocella conradii]AFC99902.1 putative aminoglycoside phosphotransferase [Methanocella conradii HZ254]